MIGGWALVAGRSTNYQRPATSHQLPPVKTSDFDYDLPPEFIAQTPVEPRDASRLMVLDRETGNVEHRIFRDLPDCLRAGDVLVLNETRVIPARLHARKQTGGRVEILLLKPIGPVAWEALIGGKGVRLGSRLSVEGREGLGAIVRAELGDSRRVVEFSEPINLWLARLGEMPLPPYIHERLRDRDRYQTVYARAEGSAAAPTAGLHFTPRLMDQIRGAGVETAFVTLHVGIDTFAPVNEDDPSEHELHGEWCQVTADVAGKVNAARRSGGRVVAVGTTTVRTLESAAQAALPGETVSPFEGRTELFILPGFPFRAVDAMITNFHLPRSTLLMLVSAFAGARGQAQGREKILAAYELAKREGYRFYSFGDAMLIV